MNPKRILYGACILVNESWWLGRFQFIAFVSYNVFCGGGNPMVKTLLGQSAKCMVQEKGANVQVSCV